MTCVRSADRSIVIWGLAGHENARTTTTSADYSPTTGLKEGGGRNSVAPYGESAFFFFFLSDPRFRRLSTIVLIGQKTRSFARKAGRPRVNTTSSVAVLSRHRGVIARGRGTTRTGDIIARFAAAGACERNVIFDHCAVGTAADDRCPIARRVFLFFFLFASDAYVTGRRRRRKTQTRYRVRNFGSETIRNEFPDVCCALSAYNSYLIPAAYIIHNSRAVWPTRGHVQL